MDCYVIPAIDVTGTVEKCGEIVENPWVGPLENTAVGLEKCAWKVKAQRQPAWIVGYLTILY